MYILQCSEAYFYSANFQDLLFLLLLLSSFSLSKTAGFLDVCYTMNSQSDVEKNKSFSDVVAITTFQCLSYWHTKVVEVHVKNLLQIY